jgi:uncharacterized repeat protein (TIGR03806 family)
VNRALALVALVGACGGDADEVCDVDGKMCERLSSWELFEDIKAQEPAPDVIAYDLNTPLFSDYTVKNRFVRVPAGMAATWSDTGPIDLPVGSVLVKTFSYDAHIETRLLVHGASGWHGAAYIYDDDGRDAKLAIAGGLPMPANNPNYAVPNQNQCKSCHAEHDDIVAPLGPKAWHVQPERLQAMVDAGALVGAPPVEQWPKRVDAFDAASGSLDERARAWLDINCGFCHNPTGNARTSGLFLDRAETDLAELGVCKAPVATGRGSGGRLHDIVPGQPDASILVYRIESTEPEIRMPEIGRNLVHAEGVALIREWITAMTGVCTP